MGHTVSQVGVSDMALSCQLCREGSSKKQWTLPALLSEKVAPPLALALMLDDSFSLCLSLVPFKLLF